MSTIITSIDKHSPAEKAGIKVGEKLVEINGHEVVDVLDYRFYGYDSTTTLKLIDDDTVREVKIKKIEGQDLGLNFETYLIDEMKTCSNHCIFCFVDQMPPNMRESLYIKDDDARLSFLLGNYTTLTNISDREAQRIIDLHISPINVSVHSTDPSLRCKMLGNVNAYKSLEYMQAFGKAGIGMNGQIVVCPGWNDGDNLRRTLQDLMDMNFQSCSIVPLGLTKYRKGLAKLSPVTKDVARDVIAIVNEYGEKCIKKTGSRVFFCSDEFYLKAELDLPEDEYYEDYRQLENGVGMLRLLESEFISAMHCTDEIGLPSPFTIVTGVSAAPFLEHLLNRAKEAFPSIKGSVFPIVNDFFGNTIDVAGLVTGQDIVKQLKGHDLGKRILVPINMLRHGENVFLDDYTVEQIENELNVVVQIVNSDGGDLFDTIIEEKEY